MKWKINTKVDEEKRVSGGELQKEWRKKNVRTLDVKEK